MNIPFLDLKANYNSVKADVDAAIQNVLDNTAYILGASVQNFEKDFAAAQDVKYCLGTSSGTDANHLVLWGLGIGAGDEVIIPANTFIATAWGATLCGATPVFVDCHPESYNMDPFKIEEAITSKTKAIVAVHLYGQSADLDPLKEIAKNGNEADMKGVELIYQKFKNKLADKGLKPMTVNAGDDFNVDFHEAITQIPAPTPELKGKIIDVIETGYQLADKVIRFAKVVTGN